MIMEILSWAAVLLALATVTIQVLVDRDWRLALGALAVQYLAVFILVIHHLPIAMGSAKLITGWMIAAALAMTRMGLPVQDAEEADGSSLLHAGAYRLILMIIVGLVTFGATPRIEAVIPGMGLPVIAGGLILIGGGLIHLGVTSDLMRVILGLLTVLSGFEIVYAAVESSILVTGFLSVVSLGLGLSGCYLLLAGRDPAEDEA